MERARLEGAETRTGALEAQLVEARGEVGRVAAELGKEVTAHAACEVALAGARESLKAWEGKLGRAKRELEMAKQQASVHIGENIKLSEAKKAALAELETTRLALERARGMSKEQVMGEEGSKRGLWMYCVCAVTVERLCVRVL